MQRTLVIINPTDGDHPSAVVLEHEDTIRNALGAFAKAIADWAHGRNCETDEESEEHKKAASYCRMMRGSNPFYHIQFGPGETAWSHLKAAGIQEVFYLRHAPEYNNLPIEFEAQAAAAGKVEGFTAVTVISEENVESFFEDEEDLRNNAYDEEDRVESEEMESQDASVR